MSIVVVGSVAFDTIKTPFGYREKSLGGAANYFSVSAQFFCPIQMVGIIGEDFPVSHLDFLKSHNVDLSGLVIGNGPSFHWQGEYGHDLNEAKTISTELNVFASFKPELPEHYLGAETVFLANIDPKLQIHVLKQLKNPKLKALDTMNYWIENQRKDLLEAISLIDILFINDAEIRQLTGEINIVKAAKAANKMGARIVVIKRGEFGSLLCVDNDLAYVPAFLLEEVFDPTGAGDTFAGGFLGELSSKKKYGINELKKAMITGTVMSSFVIQEFSFDRLLKISNKDIEERKHMLMRQVVSNC